MIFSDYSWDDLYRINKKKAFYGVGRVFKKIVFYHKDILKYISCLIDNDPAKRGTYIVSDDIHIPVITLNDFLKKYNIDDYFIVITLGSKALVEVYNTMMRLPMLDRISFAIPVLMDDKQKYIDEIQGLNTTRLKRRKKQLIPKKIHYCWFGHAHMPDNYKKYIDSWHKFCPEYEIIKWDESNYDVNKNSFIKSAYKSQKWAYVSDYARLDIVYNEGGIYLDTDVELLRPFDELLYQTGFMGMECEEYINTGLGFGAIKGSSLIKKLLELYSDIEFDAEHPIPCTLFQLELFRKEGFIPENGYQIIDDFSILPDIYLSPKNQVTGITRTCDKTFAIHHYDASWLNDSSSQKRDSNWLIYRSIINGKCIE